MGHIKRSLILAKVLSDKYKVIFVMKDYPDGVSFVRGSGIEVQTIDINNDNDKILIDICRKLYPKKIIFDLYDNSYRTSFEYAHAEGIQTVVFDTLGRLSASPDILINDSLTKNHIDYSYLSKRTKVYTGLEYFLSDNLPAPPILRDSVKDVMITMGGSDPTGLTLKIVRSTLNIISEYNISIVLGPCFKEKTDIYRLIKNADFVKVYENPDNFLKILNRQDVVITAAGRILYECACLGRPTIMVPSIDHEVIVSSEFAKLTGSFDIGDWNEDTSPDKIMKALKEYQKNYALRESISKNSRTLLDGLGVQRVLSIISN